MCWSAGFLHPHWSLLSTVVHSTMLTYCLRQILSHEWFCTLIGATPFLAREVNAFNPPRSPGPIFSPNESLNENRDWYKATPMTGLLWALFTDNASCPAAVLPSVCTYQVGGQTLTEVMCNKCVYSFRGCAPENVPLKWCYWAEGSTTGFWTTQGQRAIPHVDWTYGLQPEPDWSVCYGLLNSGHPQYIGTFHYQCLLACLHTYLYTWVRQHM